MAQLCRRRWRGRSFALLEFEPRPFIAHMVACPYRDDRRPHPTAAGSLTPNIGTLSFFRNNPRGYFNSSQGKSLRPRARLVCDVPATVHKALPTTADPRYAQPGRRLSPYVVEKEQRR